MASKERICHAILLIVRRALWLRLYWTLGFMYCAWRTCNHRRIIPTMPHTPTNDHTSKLSAGAKAVTTLGKRLYWLFLVLFVLYCLAAILVCLYSIFPPEGFSYVGPPSILLLLPVVFKVLAGGLALFLVAKMMKSISKGASPFSPSASFHVKIIAIILLLGVISGIFIEPGSWVGAVADKSTMAYEFGGSNRADVYIDTTSLFLSIICFALSTIIRYGALLQNEVNDLV